jgi:hypothetical protein
MNFRKDLNIWTEKVLIMKRARYNIFVKGEQMQRIIKLHNGEQQHDTFSLSQIEFSEMELE